MHKRLFTAGLVAFLAATIGVGSYLGLGYARSEEIAKPLFEQTYKFTSLEERFRESAYKAKVERDIEWNPVNFEIEKPNLRVEDLVASKSDGLVNITNNPHKDVLVGISSDGSKVLYETWFDYLGEKYELTLVDLKQNKKIKFQGDCSARYDLFFTIGNQISADGNKIVFNKNQKVYLLDFEKNQLLRVSDTKDTYETLHSVSQNGNKMLYDKYSDYYRIDDEMLMGFFERPAGETEQEKINFRFVLALVLMREQHLKHDSSRTEGDKEIWRLRIPGNKRTVEVINPHLDEQQIEQLSSQIGQGLQYVSYKEVFLHVIDLKNKKKTVFKRLPLQYDHVFFFRRGENAPSFSSDGEKVVFTCSEKFKGVKRPSDVDREIYLADFTSNKLINLSNTPDRDDAAPIISPDGTKVVYYAKDPVIGLDWEIKLIDLEDKKEYVVVPDLPYIDEIIKIKPMFSPDSKKFVIFFGGDIPGTFYIGDTEKKVIRNLSSEPFTSNHDPVFVNSDRIIFYTIRKGLKGIFTADLNNNTLKRLIKKTSYLKDELISLDGKRLFLNLTFSQDEKDFEIYLLNLDSIE